MTLRQDAKYIIDAALKSAMPDTAVEKALKDLRAFMFERVYRNPVAKGQESKTELFKRGVKK